MKRSCVKLLDHQIDNYYFRTLFVLSVIVTLTSASFVFNCKMFLEDSCFNFDAKTNRQNADKARVSEINLDGWPADSVII